MKPNFRHFRKQACSVRRLLMGENKDRREGVGLLPVWWGPELEGSFNRSSTWWPLPANCPGKMPSWTNPAVLQGCRILSKIPTFARTILSLQTANRWEPKYASALQARTLKWICVLKKPFVFWTSRTDHKAMRLTLSLEKYWLPCTSPKT